VCRTFEDAHVRAEFGDDDRAQHPIDTWDLGETLAMLAVRVELCVDARIELPDVLVQLLQPRELHLQDEAMVLLDLAFERKFELAELLAEALLGELRHLCGQILAELRSFVSAPARIGPFMTRIELTSS
jgi:hypothetical protein